MIDVSERWEMETFSKMETNLTTPSSELTEKGDRVQWWPRIEDQAFQSQEGELPSLRACIRQVEARLGAKERRLGGRNEVC